jgi:hypothetical protein
VKRAYLITEGRLNSEILKMLLPKDLIQSVEFVPASSSYSVQSLARSILATRRAPVAVVLDAETDDEQKIREQKEFYEQTLNQVSTRTMFGVFIAKPDLPSILLKYPRFVDWLEHHRSSRSNTDSNRQQKLLEEIKKVFDPQEEGSALLSLDHRTLEQLRKNLLLRSLTKFLGSVARAKNHRSRVA